MVDWKGVFPAVTTKMNQSGRIDLPATQSGLERLIGSDVSGVVILPMLGENASLTSAEKEMVIRGAREVVSGRVPLLSGLAEISSDAAVSAAKAFESFGADGLMVFPSLGYKTDPRETAAWFRNIAHACGIPIMIYNNPVAYGVDVTPRILQNLADTPSIVCVKEETGDIRRVTDLYNELGDRFAIFCGVDDLILESVALGATGWVSGMANAWPKECVSIFNLCARGRFDEARSLYRIMTPAFHLDVQVKLVQYIKFAEHLVYGAPEWTRSPRLPLVDAEREHVAGIITKTIGELQRGRLPA